VRSAVALVQQQVGDVLAATLAIDLFHLVLHIISSQAANTRR
jgi:hypothetical protein